MKRHAPCKSWTIPQLAERWDAHAHTVRRMVKDGRLSAFRMGPPPGGQFRVLDAERERFERAAAIRVQVEPA